MHDDRKAWVDGRAGTRACIRRGLSAGLTLLTLACSSVEPAKAPDAAHGDAANEEDAGALDAGESSCGSSSETLSACVDKERLRADVEFVAKPRVPGSAHWQAVQDLCAERFAAYGFDVERHRYSTGVNVIGTRRGADKPDEQVIISAHYDHIADCPGADDNATGVAAVLETARVLKGIKLERTLLLACWDEEERGLIGALAYAARARERGDKIIAMTSLEMIGYKSDAPNSQKIPTGFDVLFPQQHAAVAANQFRGDFVSLVGLDTAAPLSEAFVQRAKQAGLPSSLITLTRDMATNPLLSDLSRSDHAAFWLQGFPSLLVTDSSNFRYAQYHCRNGDDVPSLLSFDFLTDVTRASVAAHLDVLGLK